jgi:Cu-processing system ATP-binding protein
VAELCRLQQIHMQYGREQVLRGVELSIQRGSILGLVGENGSGKSTLLKILSGVLHPDSGDLRGSGERPQIGYMPENCQWYPYLTGAQVLRYFSTYVRASADAQQEILTRVGLWASRDKKVAAYSKGMKQKLGLAQALLGRPELLVLDEPTNGLDPRGIIDFYRILREHADNGATVVLSSHLLAEIEDHITHVAFLRDGRILRSGACTDLVEHCGLPSRVCLRDEGDAELLEPVLRSRGWTVQDGVQGMDILLPRGQVGSLLHAVSGVRGELGDIEIRHAGLNDLYLHTFHASTTPTTALEALPTPARNGDS